jgi:peptidoglycan hydrolase-like protein with peptidoglycan-binding domain
MTPQNPDLSLNQKGKDVALLHSRLMTLGYKIDTSEILNEVFGPSTYQAVISVQRDAGLPVTGVVGAATAQALVRKFESERTTISFSPAHPAPPQKPPPAAPSAPETGRPVEAAQPPTSAPRPAPPTSAPPPDPARSAPPPAATAPPPASGSSSNPYSLQGNLRFDHGLPASGVTVRLYNVGFAGQDERLGETRTDAQGQYAFSYRLPQQLSPNVQVRVVDANQREVPISNTIFHARAQEGLNLIVPASIQPPAPEYQRLAADLEKTIGGLGKLAQAQEGDSRQDLSLLYQTTGWDARLLSLAANAATLSQTTGLGQDALYALLRAGLPTDPQRLALLSPAVVEKALGKANQAAIVSLTDQQIAGAVSTFKSFADKTRLTLTAAGTNATFGDLLKTSGLNADQQSAFAGLFFSQAVASDGFWQQAAALKIPAETLNALKLQGKLAYLTLNNAALAAQLQKDIGSLDNLAQLPEKDLHTDAAWKQYLTALAGPTNTQALDALIPPAYVGNTTADRLAAYAADLARKVRLSFPTQVVARMVEKGDLTVGNAPKITTFLKNAAPLGFQLGRTPLNAFVKQNQANLFQGIAPADVAATTESVKTLHRLYQITPGNESLQALLKLGITSAYDLASLDAPDFLERFGAAFPSTDEAMLVYQKAQQVNTLILHLYLAAKQLDTSPPIYSLSPAALAREGAKAAIIEQFPTMQSLFGSLDFCDCEDCRSVLSPAAYLVDLLRFIDPADTNWNQFLANWKNTHNQKNYADTYLKPYDALVARRPDLPNLPLTCENTNTVLPYIDVVNEIFEYYIVNGALDANAAYDTGEAESADLLAEPQNILPQAYAILNSAQYPLGLPFDLWIETVRRFLGYFKTPLWKLLDVFKAADPLELFTDANAYPYYRAGILAEYLGISPAEYALFTSPDPLANWFKLYGYNDQTTALNELKYARTLSQKLGVSYQDIVDLVKTGLLNPQLQNLVIAQKLDIQPDDLFSYEGMSGYPPMTPAQKTAFEAALDALTQKYNPTNNPNGFNARNWLSTTWNSGGFNHILLLEDPDGGCNFDQTTLQYADGSAAAPSLFLTLNLFARLWKKLGWTLEETDRALQVFLAPHLPPDSDANFGADYAAAMKTALVYLAHLQALYQDLQPGQQGRVRLLTFWSNLPTTGTNPLYAQLFLNVSSVNYDPVFDDPRGNYLAGSLLIKDHLSALQGALSLTSDDVGLILADAGLDVNTAPLSLPNVSLLYRCALLARALKLSITDFLSLKALSGLNPFAPLSAQPLAALADDVIWTQTIAFVEQARKVKGSGFAIADVQYLLRHQFDPVGKYRADPAALMQLVRSVANTIHQIQAGNAVPTDPLTFTDQIITQKLALAFPAEAVQTFMGMWTGTIKYTAVLPGVLPADKLDPATLAQFPAIQVSYDQVKQEQQLTYQGVLLSSQIGPIEAANTSPVLASLLTMIQGQAQSFFQKYFQLATIGQETIGFLPASDFDLLFAPIPASATDAQKQQQMSQKRAELAKTFLPYLQQKLIRQAIIQAMAADRSADASLIDALTTNASLLADPTQPSRPLLDAFASVAASGLSVSYYASTDGIGVPLATGIALTADTTDANTPKPAGTQSARFEGALEVPADGAYRFFAELGKQNAQVTLQFDAPADPLILAVAASDKAEVSNVIELKAGIPYHFTLDFHNLGGGDASLLVQGENLPQGALSQLTLYVQAAVDRFTRAYVLLKKSLQLIQGFNLSEREITYLLTHSADFSNLSFSALPTQASDDSPPKAVTLFGQFLRLAAYTSLKQGPAGGSDGLIDVFEQAEQTFLASANPTTSAQAVLQTLYQTVANLTRRKKEVVQASAEQLGFNVAPSQIVGGQLVVKAPDFAQEQGLRRLWDALQVVQAIGIPADTLAASTGIIDSTKTQDARAALADNLKNAVKAHYTADAWRPIAQSIFDKLRQEKRDALSAYLLNKLALENSGQLFEYFLVDPGMEPVVQTSRLRLALSSVQTFIQRCLLNLEAKVDPSAIPANQWEWMKRYRVWQANREIFLWPENWMEPEWRLDKTDLFQALESALLQGDITSDLVEDAFFTYLKDLDVRARLDIVTMYLEEASTSAAANVLHVIGRNHGKPQKYFYRRFAYGVWSAWEPVKVDIEGDHLALVKWRERLHLFWVTFSTMSKAPPLSAQNSSASNKQLVNMNFNDLASNLANIAPQKQVQLQLNWSEYFQGKWTDRKSSGLLPTPPIDVSPDFDPRSTYIHVAKETDAAGNEGAVKIMLDGSIWQAFRLVGKNSEPTLKAADYEWPQYYDYLYTYEGQDATKTDGAGAFDVDFPAETKAQNGQITDFTFTNEAILQQGNDFAILVCDTPALPMSTQTDLNGWLAANVKALGLPFFYQDLDNGITMFVQPSLAEKTITEWLGWVIPLPFPYPYLISDQWWKNLSLQSQVPVGILVDHGDPAPESIYQLRPRIDWATSPGTALTFGTTLIGQSGALKDQQTQRAGAPSINISASGMLNNGRLSAGLASASGTRLNVITSAGLNVAGLQAATLAQSTRFNHSAVNPTLNQAGGGIR